MKNDKLKQGNMISTQVYLTEEQTIGLKSLVVGTGKKQSELIREAIDNLLNSSDPQGWKVAIKSLQGVWEDREDIPSIEEMRKEADDRITNR